jgi:hypothetical protein
MQTYSRSMQHGILSLSLVRVAICGIQIAIFFSTSHFAFILGTSRSIVNGMSGRVPAPPLIFVADATRQPRTPPDICA